MSPLAALLLLLTAAALTAGWITERGNVPPGGGFFVACLLGTCFWSLLGTVALLLWRLAF